MRKFLHLPRAERLLLLKALVVTALVRSGLTLLSFPRLRRLVARSMTPRHQRSSSMPVERIAWCVRAASRFVPRATCLTQALTAQILMARRGYAGELRIGVARDRKGAFNAHAWIEYGGRIVIGGDAGYEEFTPLPQWDVRDL